MVISEIPTPPGPLAFWSTKEELEGAELGSGGSLISVEEYLYRACPQRVLPFPIIKWYNFRKAFYSEQHERVENSLLSFTGGEWSALLIYLMPPETKEGWFNEWEESEE